MISGLLNGGVAFNALGNDSTITQFETIGGNLTLVDELFITVSPLGGTTSFNIDNIVLNTVDRQLPEPGSLALLGAALAVAGWRSRRNQRA